MPVTRKRNIKEPIERKAIDTNSLNFGALYNVETEEATGEIFIEAVEGERAILVAIPLHEVKEIVEAIIEVASIAEAAIAGRAKKKKNVRKYVAH